MKVLGPGQASPIAPRRTERAGAAASAFALPTGGEGGATATRAAAPLAPVDALLSLQELPDATRGRSRGLKRGNNLLDRLDEIRHGLLMGEIPVQRLIALEAQLREEGAAIADPHMVEILGEIELRCAVELAKLGR
jgi:hypothetical protein